MFKRYEGRGGGLIRGHYGRKRSTAMFSQKQFLSEKCITIYFYKIIYTYLSYSHIFISFICPISN